MYALNLSEDNRILSVTYERFASEDMPKVKTLPDGNVSDYRYINNKYIYDPMPEPEPPVSSPTIEERVKQTEADIEFIAMMTGIDMEG